MGSKSKSCVCLCLLLLTGQLLFISISNSYGGSTDRDVLLFEDWEKNNFTNWDDDFEQGDTVIDSEPVLEGKYALKQKTTNPGNYIHNFGDHPHAKVGMVKKVFRRLGGDIGKGAFLDDITVEAYLYPSPDFQWPRTDMKLWIMNCFEKWGAGYNKANGKGKPFSFAPYYVVIAADGRGRPFGRVVRADGLGGRGERWGAYVQNQGPAVELSAGKWNKLKFRLVLNTPGKKDGVFKLWLNDQLKCDYVNLNLRGTYTKYGWNQLAMSVYPNPGHPKAQWMSRDNIRIVSGAGDDVSPPLAATQSKLFADAQSESVSVSTEEADPGELKRGSTKDGNIILYEDWEQNHLSNWDDDLIPGAVAVEKSPVYEGEYAVKERSTKICTYAHFFGDHPGVDGEEVADVTLESYIYFSRGFSWPTVGMKLWIMNSYEKWGAGYKKAEGKGKPNTWAPYYMTIGVQPNGQVHGELVRSDGLGGRGARWKPYGQNIGKPVAFGTGKWHKLRIRFKLNTPGREDGLFKIWIDDELKCDYSNVNYRGTYTRYGWNHLIMSILGNPTHSETQWVSRDNIILLSDAGDYITSDKMASPHMTTQISASSVSPKPGIPPKKPVRIVEEAPAGPPSKPSGLRIVQ